MGERLKRIGHEFQHHFPFTILASFLAIIGMAVYTELIAPAGLLETAHEGAHGHEAAGNHLIGLFHILHPIHVFLSASATAAMFWRYDRRLLMAVVTGLLGSLIVCGLSDIVFPFIGGLVLQQEMHLHLCIAEHPGTVLAFAGLGLTTGIFAANGMNAAKASMAAHTMHVLISTASSMLYLIGFGLHDWTSMLVPVFVILVFSVIIPCCTSDILFPLLLVNDRGVHWCVGCHGEEETHDK